MNNLQIISFLKPDVRRLILFGILSFICIGGVIQTYAFIDDVSGIPKPPFYDLLRPLDLWVPWLILAFPVHFLGQMLNVWLLIEYFPEISPGFKLSLLSIAYSYVLSCWTFYSWDEWLSKSPYKKLLILIGIIPAIFHCPVFFLWPQNLDYLSTAISGFSFSSLILIVYVISIYGLYRVVSSFKSCNKDS